MPTMTVLSPAMRRLRHQGIEIRQRMATALAPTGAIAKNKKPSPPPPYASVLALPAAAFHPCAYSYTPALAAVGSEFPKFHEIEARSEPRVLTI
ncbi:hypothetical protein HU200_051361 [Digitaria exilis]|uniref:Uncharacterized protein n=1 Tax=Digitaria exilis TaxID=1010633 RepID=A0A835E9L9_9POAL|nr:hypothetical protein HU200_051361 [Digitaria exilis]